MIIGKWRGGDGGRCCGKAVKNNFLAHLIMRKWDRNMSTREEQRD
jgi:hypothetical protein